MSKEPHHEFMEIQRLTIIDLLTWFKNEDIDEETLIDNLTFYMGQFGLDCIHDTEKVEEARKFLEIWAGITGD